MEITRRSITKQALFALMAGLVFFACSKSSDQPAKTTQEDTPAEARQAIEPKDAKTDLIEPGIDNPFADKPEAQRKPSSAETESAHGQAAGTKDAKPETANAADTGIPSPSTAQPAALAPELTVSGDASGLVWEPQLDTPTSYESMDMRLSGPGGLRIDQEFAGQEPVSITRDLPDGLYKWETVTTPTLPDWARKEMKEVRKLGNPEAERELATRLRSQGYLPTEEQAKSIVKSGHFRLHNGQLVDSRERE